MENLIQNLQNMHIVQPQFTYLLNLEYNISTLLISVCSKTLLRAKDSFDFPLSSSAASLRELRRFVLRTQVNDCCAPYAGIGGKEGVGGGPGEQASPQFTHPNHPSQPPLLPLTRALATHPTQPHSSRDYAFLTWIVSFVSGLQ